PSSPPCLPRARCGATRRTPEASSRSAWSLRLALEVIHQPRERVEPHHARRVGHEVRERVDVVVVPPPVASVDQVLDSADVDVRRPHDALDLGDDLRRRLVALHPEIVLRRAPPARALPKARSAARPPPSHRCWASRPPGSGAPAPPRGPRPRG